MDTKVSNNSGSTSEELLLSLLSCYRIVPISGGISLMVKSLEKYHPTAIESASEIMLRNEDYFTIKKLTDIIEDFDLQPKEQDKPNEVASWPSHWERAGMSLMEWESMREEAAYEEDHGMAILERMQNDPESFRKDRNEDD